MENEKIGKILLDYSLYPGEDFYCDGDIEQEILEKVKKITEGAKEFPDENNAENDKNAGDAPQHSAQEHFRRGNVFFFH